MEKEYKICNRCVLDTTVSDIEFDINGVCNYCRAYDDIIKTIPAAEEAKQVLDGLVKKIKQDGKGKEYDCIIGMSGGVDSTYLSHLVVQLGLRPLVVHVDTGWNSEIAVGNIENAVKRLGLDLFTYVIDWEEMADLQLAYFKASLPDCDIPQDHVFPAVLHKIAAQHKIKHMISGHNIVTEFILPRPWAYDSNDLSNLLDVHEQFGTKKLRKYPKYSLFDRSIYYRIINPIYSHRFLYYINYNKEDAQQFITNNMGWRDYGGKHYESRFTKFFQAYYLPTKFGFDKRKAHLSNLIVSNQLSRTEALEELRKPLYDKNDLNEDIDYVTRKLNIDLTMWETIMAKPKNSHYNFKRDVDIWWFKLMKKINASRR